MKRFLNYTVLLTLSFFLFQCSSNSLEDKFQKDLDKYVAYTNTANWEGLLDLTYPKVFELSSREQMLESMKQMEASGMKITTKKAEVDEVSELINLEGTDYVHLTYNGDIEIRLSGMLADKSTIIFTQLKDSYGEGSVEFDEKNNMFGISAKKSMIAVSGDGQKTWTYFEFNDNQKAILSKLFPEEISSKYGE